MTINKVERFFENEAAELNRKCKTVREFAKILKPSPLKVTILAYASRIAEEENWLRAQANRLSDVEQNENNDE
jgi:hypothetical protein